MASIMCQGIYMCVYVHVCFKLCPTLYLYIYVRKKDLILFTPEAWCLQCYNMKSD